MAVADIDCVVLGAGVIGLAIARKLAMSGREVIITEAGPSVGTGISSRNSEVIHAGIYYPPGSLKAKLCVAGKQQLYAYCTARNIPFKQLGKLIVATTPDQTLRLDAIVRQAVQCGVDDLSIINGRQAREMEPELVCAAAVVSPSTGIVDSHALMLALQGDAENHGASCIFHTPFTTGKIVDTGQFALEFGGADPMTLTANCVVNATGLAATSVARALHGQPLSAIPRSYLCKGSYFSLAGRAPFKRLIYPMPDNAGLGVHLTLDMGGQARFGPDTEWTEHEEYSLDPDRAAGFYAAIRRYWPNLPDDTLQPAYAGIRPKIVSAGQPAADFVIAGPATHGVAQLLNLYGMESPGLTACLAIADTACAALGHAPTTDFDCH